VIPHDDDFAEGMRVVIRLRLRKLTARKLDGGGAVGTITDDVSCVVGTITDVWRLGDFTRESEGRYRFRDMTITHDAGWNSLQLCNALDTGVAGGAWVVALEVLNEKTGRTHLFLRLLVTSSNVHGPHQDRFRDFEGHELLFEPPAA
jgi:hypothetical protein